VIAAKLFFHGGLAGADGLPHPLSRIAATLLGALALASAWNGVGAKAAEDQAPHGIGVRVSHVTSSNLNIYDCQLRLDVRNHLDIPILAMAGTLKVYDANGNLLAAPLAESTRIGPGTERRDAFGFKVDVEGGLNPSNQLELVEQCNILKSAEYVLHACLDEHGDDIFDRCAAGLYQMADSALPLRFLAVHELDPFTRGVPEAKTERMDEAREIHLAEYGLTLSTITASLADRFDVAPDQKGLLVVSIDGDGSAARVGLRAGDLVSEIDQQEVADIATARRLFESAFAADRAILLLVDRGETPVFTVLPAH